ncbi:hypothetical protein MY04_4947 [Flammeovirga sp. MY04]|uniref:leucine-rich repeat domain-containing protein n=1 Tax=Flammeovirga sp. MY04 TaxID=1191459 RepID=UPI000806187C|nr:TIR-NBS-LRR class disease resistance protein [Flammeovirga sp. MY04]ANQ52282.1 hypothetical protein MY04_4947 [Flammeovirga sp. MY04]
MEETEALERLEKKYNDSFNYVTDDSDEFVTKVIIKKNKELTEFPNELKAFKKLRRISLLNCNIKEIPYFVTEFDSLEEIAVVGSPIQELPDFLGKIKTLRSLNISGTDISEFPESLYELPIRTLILKGSKVVGFPESLYHWDKSLKILALEKADNLPSDMSRFTKLDWLYAELKSFKFVDEIPNLRILYLNNSTAKYLPENLGNLQKLEDLNLKDCKNLVKLPNSIGNLSLLESINLGGCERLTGLPQSMAKLKLGSIILDRCYNLKSITSGLTVGSIVARDTKWKSMPLGVFKSTAHDLWVTNHQITDITGIGNLYNLESCNLSYGKIKKIPEGVGRLKKLYTFSIEHNEIDFVPSAVENAPELDGVRTFGNPAYDMEQLNNTN